MDGAHGLFSNLIYSFQVRLKQFPPSSHNGINNVRYKKGRSSPPSNVHFVRVFGFGFLFVCLFAFLFPFLFVKKERTERGLCFRLDFPGQRIHRVTGF